MNVPALARLAASLTGEPPSQLEQRARWMREANLLPADNRATRVAVSDADIARFALAMVASETHEHAPEAVRRYSALPPWAATGRDDKPRETPFGEATLLEVLGLLVREARHCKGWELIAVTAYTNAPVVAVGAWRLTPRDEVRLMFGGPAHSTTGWPRPLLKMRSMDGAVFAALANGGAERVPPGLTRMFITGDIELPKRGAARGAAA